MGLYRGNESWQLLFGNFQFKKYILLCTHVFLLITTNSLINVRVRVYNTESLTQNLPHHL